MSQDFNFVFRIECFVETNKEIGYFFHSYDYHFRELRTESIGNRSRCHHSLLNLYINIVDSNLGELVKLKCCRRSSNIYMIILLTGKVSKCSCDLLNSMTDINLGLFLVFLQ